MTVPFLAIHLFIIAKFSDYQDAPMTVPFLANDSIIIAKSSLSRSFIDCAFPGN